MLLSTSSNLVKASFFSVTFARSPFGLSHLSLSRLDPCFYCEEGSLSTSTHPTKRQIKNHRFPIYSSPLFTHVFIPFDLVNKKMRRSYTKPSPLEKANRGGVDWEVRPGGMLVQKRSGHCGVGPAAQTIKVLVSQGSYLHEVTVPPQATFGIEFFFFLSFLHFPLEKVRKSF